MKKIPLILLLVTGLAIPNIVKAQNLVDDQVKGKLRLVYSIYDARTDSVKAQISILDINGSVRLSHDWSLGFFYRRPNIDLWFKFRLDAYPESPEVEIYGTNHANGFLEATTITMNPHRPVPAKFYSVLACEANDITSQEFLGFGNLEIKGSWNWGEDNSITITGRYEGNLGWDGAISRFNFRAVLIPDIE